MRPPDPEPEASRMKPVKVKIPVSHHIKLHAMKVLAGKQLSDAVTEALDAYFESPAYARLMAGLEEEAGGLAPAPPE